MSLIHDRLPSLPLRCRGSCWFGLIVVLLALLFLGLFAWFFGLKMFMRYQIQKSMDPAGYQRMIHFLDSPFEFPKEWAEVAPYSAELQSASQELVEVLKDLTSHRIKDLHKWCQGILRKVNHGGTLNNEDWEEVEGLQKENDRIVRAVQKLAEAPDYEIDAIPGSASNELLPKSEIVFLVSDLLCLSGHSLVLEGRWAEAVDSVLSALRLTRRNPATTLLGHLVGMTSQMVGSVTLSALSLEIEDPLLLEKIVREMNALDEHINPDILERGLEMDILGLLRLAKRRGADVDLSPGQLGRSYFQQCVLSGVIMAGTVGQASQESVPAPLMGSIVDTMFSIYFSPSSFKEAHIREKASRVIFDLTRLSILNRIRELKGESPSVTTADLIDGDLPTQPVDVFVDQPFLWDASAEDFYSVGPDEKDDLNLLQYSPTNGVISVGDISLR